jgi:predicted ATPase
MQLRHIETGAGRGTERAWKALVDLGQTTLIVGRNATGKSKVLASIRSLANMIANRQRFPDAHFKVSFDDPVAAVEYELHIDNGVVRTESLTVAAETVLTRSEDGQGTIKAIAAGVNDLAFQIPTHELAVVAKRDSKQHPFLEPLHVWAQALRFYRFNDFQKMAFGLFLQGAGGPPDPSDYHQSIGLFAAGMKKLGQPFKFAIIEDMKRIGYAIDDVTLAELEEVKIDPPIGGKPMGLSVKETDLRCQTSQIAMSDGMFRALALIVHAAYAELESVPGCMVVDDIGEGLDYERSTALIKLLMERANRSAIQLVMSTNDRFAMNAVPLDVWCGLRRTPDGVETVTKKSHPEVFEQFRLTGLNNFDFFRMDYFEAATPNG